MRFEKPSEKIDADPDLTHMRNSNDLRIAYNRVTLPGRYEVSSDKARIQEVLTAAIEALNDLNLECGIVSAHNQSAQARRAMELANETSTLLERSRR